MIIFLNVVDIKAGCFAFGGALKERKNWTLQQCDIDCCQGVNCNIRTPTLSKAAFTVFAPTGNTNKYSWHVDKKKMYEVHYIEFFHGNII